MPGISQSSQDGEPAEGELLTAGGGSLTAAEVRALAAADLAEGGGWPLPADGGAGGDRWGFGEGGALDEAPPSLLLAGFAEEACGRFDQVDDDSLIGVLRACRRLVSQAQARELAVVAELARRRPAPGAAPGPPGRSGLVPEQVGEHVEDEVAAALTLTGRAAQRHVGLAVDLAVHWRTAAALAAGRIDLPKALVMLAAIVPLGEIEAAAVEAAVLPCAGGLTTGELRAWLARLVLAVDPAAARRRREQAERHAHVACWADPEGTATLAGRFLPPAEVLAADQRIAAIAQAWKKAGAHGGLDLLRAHAYLALLLGQDTATPPAVLLTPGPRTGGCHPPGADASGEEGQPVADPVPAGLRCAGGQTPPLPVTGTVNLTVPLITLLGLADRPGEVPGYGPLHADTCRTLADALASHPTTAWAVVVTDPDGGAMGLGGPARLRPVKPPGRARGSPTSYGAGGWTITLTTRPIAPYF